MAIKLFYGLPGMGKSLAMHDLVAAQCHEHRFFIADHEDGWIEDSQLWRGRPPEITVVPPGWQPPDELEDAGIWVFPVRKEGWDGRLVAELACHVGDVTLVDDELDKAGRKEGFDKSALRTIAHEGRHVLNRHGHHRPVHLMGAGRRPQKLHNDLSELAEEVFIFRVMGERTLGRLLEDEHISKDDLSILPTLPRFECKRWSVEVPGGEWLRIARPPGAPP